MLQVYNFNNNRFKDHLEDKIISWLNLLNLMTQVKKELGAKAKEFVKYDELMK
jgi:hypothetical protein